MYILTFYKNIEKNDIEFIKRFETIDDLNTCLNNHYYFINKKQKKRINDFYNLFHIQCVDNCKFLLEFD